MSWKLVFTDQYNRRAEQFLKHHLQQCEQYRKTMFCLYRITIEMVVRKNQIVPINVGNHDPVY